MDSSSLTGRDVLLGVTGGIAAYKSADLASRLVQAGAGVSVVLTTSARQFIGPTTFEALTGRPVYSELFEPREHFQGAHIGLARRAELMVVAPAGANYLAKAVSGIADDLLSTLTVSVMAPILVAPAMNAAMWQKASVQRNLRQLEDDGFNIVPPDSGWLSCGETGPGRMADPAEIYRRIVELLNATAT